MKSKHRIVKYQNRKLYNTITSEYISLRAVGKLAGDSVMNIEVLDYETKKDITWEILAKAAFEIYHNHPGFQNNLASFLVFGPKEPKAPAVSVSEIAEVA